ncbi:MAG: polysaccharide deacetylase family protein [Candidatus Eremiobacteraeota bacterium]|nr:polysaccharide deacetylase family protein [Candidatus Eremiobacteraeota bacterium]
MTTDAAQALRHRVVLVYPSISGVALHKPDFDALREHVVSGGSLLAFDLEGGGLDDVFGVAGAPIPDESDRMIWSDPSGEGGEHDLRISRHGTEARIGAVAYQPTKASIVARFDDGRAALTCLNTRGRACALGVDVGALTARSMNGREEAVARTYVNGYEPSVDNLYAWISKFYVEGEPMPWLIDTAPAGKQVSILLTHDVDFTSAMKSAADYAAALKRVGANATFFIQTKYVRDYNDDVFFNPSTLPFVKSILGAGMEVGSHSVAHSNAMKQFPMGDGLESYPSYQPFVQNRTVTINGTISGEVRVSRYLLTTLTGATVASFRAGYLSNPFGLPQALAASGYRYDSSITANSCLTHLPFQLTRDRADRSLEPVYEFPVTIEDEAKPALVSRLASANAVIDHISRSHGLAVILVHPDDTTRKLEFEISIARRWRGRAWLTSLRNFGDWWAARDQAEVDVVSTPSGWRLDVRSAAPLHDLVIKMPKLPEGAKTGRADMAVGDRQVTLRTDAGLASSAL